MTKTRLFSIAIGVMFAASAQAQITIPANTFQPSPGTMLSEFNQSSISTSFYNSVTAGTGGPMMWDFSSEIYGAEFQNIVVDPATAPQNGSYPSANLVLLGINDSDSNWSFHQSTASVYSFLGNVGHFGGMESVVAFEDVTPGYTFPLEYNDQWVSSYHWTQTTSPDIYSITYDSTFNHVDAWGTAKYGTHAIPCLRVSAYRKTTAITYVFNIAQPPFVTESYSAYFVSAGFTIPAAVHKFVTLASSYFTGTGSGDFIGGTTSILDDNSGKLPSAYSIEQNHPNPFNAQTAIQFSIPRHTNVKLTVHNVLGQQVAVLLNQPIEPGAHSAKWDGRDQYGNNVSSGIYFYRLVTRDFNATKKMVLLK